MFPRAEPAQPSLLLCDGRPAGRKLIALTVSNDEAYELVTAVAAGELDDVEGIAGRLESSTTLWS
jgi:hypothetical protein